MNTRISTVALGVAASLVAVPAAAQMQGMDHSQHTTAPPAQPLPAPAPDPHAGHDMSKMDGMSALAMGGDPGMPAAGSGTTRLPAAEGAMHGLHLMAGEWMLMLHGYAWATYSDQGGPRGDEQGFVTSMAMAEASRDLAPERAYCHWFRPSR